MRHSEDKDTVEGFLKHENIRLRATLYQAVKTVGLLNEVPLRDLQDSIYSLTDWLYEEAGK